MNVFCCLSVYDSSIQKMSSILMITTNLKKIYDPTFVVTPEYKKSLPDLQNGPASLIEGANVPIQQVGISNFKMPLRYPTRDGKELLLETSVDGPKSPKRLCKSEY